ncbi:hypothetical protein DTL42_11260 [Bremerella cremea]|uniref:RHS repeat-associated core domain-containing protein n=1 Tax=Bremerella cremea TaxID=1031537 RepID=A0A368KRP5_9BACT|nr:RHS repeat-associated core domain-containing protein [Bremerella cremea]RCS50455.1 hypothetical protein DTL42_11260 [Bremerella cremea]
MRANFSYDAEDAYQFTSISRYADLAGTELVATSTYGYDAADRLTSLTHADSSSSTLAGYTWGYDEGNRLTDFTVAGYSAEDATYTYDDTDQLTGADRSGTTSDESYTYDENGNRTGGSYSTDDNNQILSDGTYNFTYDDEGNRLTKTNISTGEVIEYSWDYRNRLVNITTKTSGGTVTHEVDYTYDIFNRRIGKTIDADGDGAGTATEEIYIYDGLREEQGNAGDHILLAFDESDDLTDRFLYGPNVDQVLASEEVTSTASAGDALWALTDHLGTVRDVADYNAGTNATTVQNHLTYDAFGNITAETNAAVDFLLAFTGRERDEESDLQYNRARYYDAAIGKWVAEDPIGFDAVDENIARYAGNNSLSFTDPSGQDIYLTKGVNRPDSGLVGLIHQDIAVDEWILDNCGGWIKSGTKVALSFINRTDVENPLKFYPASRTWLGFTNIPALPFLVSTLPGFSNEGIIYEWPKGFAPRAIISTLRTTRADDQAWVVYMRTYRVGVADRYDPIWYNCVNYTNLEFNAIAALLWRAPLR